MEVSRWRKRFRAVRRPLHVTLATGQLGSNGRLAQRHVEWDTLTGVEIVSLTQVNLQNTYG